MDGGKGANMEKITSIFEGVEVEEISDEKLKLLSEEIMWRYVVRKGKKLKKPYTTKKGYRIKYVNKRPIEVKMSPQMRRKLSVIHKRAARKARGKLKNAFRKRRQSMKKHTWKTPMKKKH